MKEQERWDDWKVHYVPEEDVIVPDPKRQVPEEILKIVKDIPVIVGTGVVSQTEIIYCLPAIITVEEDPIYDQVRKNIGYGEKFTFEAILLNSSGLTATFFAKIDPVEVGSILYVYKERQWWKVNGVEPVENGINIYCVPSELKPSFV